MKLIRDVLQHNLHKTCKQFSNYAIINFFSLYFKKMFF